MAALLLVLVLAMMSRPSSVQAWVGGKPADVQLVVIDDDGHQLRVDAAAAFRDMKREALGARVDLVVNSAFRTFEEQARLYNLYTSGRGNLAAPPGWSNHQSGVALDIESGNGTNTAYHWLVANAARFGFRRTVDSEPWHWEYRP